MSNDTEKDGKDAGIEREREKERRGVRARDSERKREREKLNGERPIGLHAVVVDTPRNCGRVLSLSSAWRKVPDRRGELQYNERNCSQASAGIKLRNSTRRHPSGGESYYIIKWSQVDFTCECRGVWFLMRRENTLLRPALIVVT